jgi:two-component system, LytTR family, sensor kinase
MRINKYHLYSWSIFGLSAIILDYLAFEDKFNIVRELVVVAIEVWVFYSFYYSVKLFSKKNTKLLLISFLRISSGVLITVILNYFRKQIAKLYGVDILNSISSFTMDTLIFYIQFGVYAIGYYYLAKDSQKNIVIKALEEQKITLQQSLQQSDLNFLRAQINPHFLQNCLNFIYSDTRKTNPDAADAVMLLSNIMRYSVTDNTAKNGMAPLTEEIKQIDNVIQIHQIRFEQKLQIQFNKAGNFENKQIVPMILLTLVENLVKYGELYDAAQPAVISCNIDEKEKTLLFTTSNKKVYVTDTISTGIGLKNIRERLQLVYNNNFTLQKQETDEWYTVKLSMPYTEEIKGNINNIKELAQPNIPTLNP